MMDILSVKVGNDWVSIPALTGPRGQKGDPGDSDLPDPPSTDGTYALQLTVSEGVATYTWVSTT